MHTQPHQHTHTQQTCPHPQTHIAVHYRYFMTEVHLSRFFLTELPLPSTELEKRAAKNVQQKIKKNWETEEI